MSIYRKETLSFLNPAVLAIFVVYSATTYIIVIFGLGFIAGAFNYDLIELITNKTYEINNLPLGRDAWGIASQGYWIMNIIIMILSGWASCVSWSGFFGSCHKDSLYLAIAYIRLIRIVIGAVAVFSSLLFITRLFTLGFDTTFFVVCVVAPLTWYLAITLHKKANKIEKWIEGYKHTTSLST